MFDKIEEAILEGLKESYDDNYSFTGEISSIIKPESLIHINIAKKLRVINDEAHDFGRPLLIKLEEPTSSFSTACVPFYSSGKDELFPEIRGFHNTTRNGNIDIALYIEGDSVFDLMPFAPIEVKDFISCRRELQLDIKRNLEYFGMIDAKTGESRLKRAYLVCIHEHKGAIKKEDKQKEIDRLTWGYKKYLDKFDFDSSKTSYSLKIETISEYLLDEKDRYLPSEIVEDKIAQAIHFIGAIIIFNKNEDKNEN